jgi:aryl-alcohol dehydrogenase-like predicted oxidoreductase
MTRTSDMYSQGSSEEIPGAALRKYANRDDVVIAAKLRHPALERPYTPRHDFQGISGERELAAIRVRLPQFTTADDHSKEEGKLAQELAG